MKRIWMAGLIVWLGSAAAGAADDPNKATYLRYCGACHGREGKGDGVASSLMQPRPSDLTRIAKQNAGEFPYLRVMETIDGRNTVRAHGDPQMPIWGEVFAERAEAPMARQAEVRRKVMAITDYVRSIQEK